MELKQFVANALVEIIEGVKTAQGTIADVGEINPSPKGVTSDYNRKEGTFIVGTSGGDVKIGTFVNFDVAVSAVDSKDTKGGISVVSGLINLGTQGTSVESNSMISRIRFQVPIVLPS